MFEILTSTITAGCLVIASQTALALPNIGAPTPIADSIASESVRVLKSGSLVDEDGRQISYDGADEDQEPVPPGGGDAE